MGKSKGKSDAGRAQKVSDRHVIPDAKGNGQIRIEYLLDVSGKLVTYSMAYINAQVYAGDNGRVIGYDNAHGYHHRHCMGDIQPVEFVSLEDTFEKFEQDWQQYLIRRKAG